ncbi:MAG: glycerol kinase GlpK [Bacteroides sp.]|nr:glycerol kinase GlpK [Bacteroides sp.]
MNNNKIIAIDQSTSATKAMLFENFKLVNRTNIEHKQYYPAPMWVEHDPIEIYNNVLAAIADLMNGRELDSNEYSLAITNQRETVVVWNKHTGLPVYNAVVWQCQRGAELCDKLRKAGHEPTVKAKSGLMIDPFFSASGVKWILDNVKGADEQAKAGDLLMGTMESWLIWKLTDGKVHACDYTNASRTQLFNIHTLDWDDELLSIYGIPRTMLPKAMPSDSKFGETTIGGLFEKPITIAGAIGDSHGALVGQMCFKRGMGKATYGTGSSVMVNIGFDPLIAPDGLVTSIGFAALGKVHYAFEGNIHCTGATIKWLTDKLQLINSPSEVEKFALSVPDNGSVYFVPAFAGLGAPWWNSAAKAAIVGMTLSTGKGHVCRAALDAIAFQIRDLIDTMTGKADITLSELRVDGGPTKNNYLMQFQANMLNVPVNRADIEEASAFGAVIMNGLARGVWSDLDQVAALRTNDDVILPKADPERDDALYAGWCNAVSLVNHR